MESIMKASKKYDQKNYATKKGDLWEVKGHIWVPPECHLKVIKNCHDTPVTGHGGHFQNFWLISHFYIWEGLQTDIQKYVQGCQTCAQYKGDNRSRARPLLPLPIPVGPWQDITPDFIVDLLKSNGFDSILTVVN